MHTPRDIAQIAAACSDALAADMADFYADLDAAIAAHRPTCWNKGACCKFADYGHKLFVTSVELAYFVRGQCHAWIPPTDHTACPYQQGGLCTAREHRPMGCRVFFCDPAAQHWQNDEYERQLEKLKAIGNRHGVDYRYIEWLSGLEDVAMDTRMHPNRPGIPAETPEIPPSIDPRPPLVIELPQVRKS